MNKFKPSSDEVSEYVREILESVFIRVRNAYADFIVSSGIATGAIKTKRQAQRAGQRLRDAFNKIVKDEIKFYRAFGVIKSLPGLDAKSVLDSHAVEFEQARQKIFKQAPLGHDEISALAELAGEALISERRSDQVSGIVFAGYGDDELYPSLHAIEIDGIVAGLLRYSEVNRVDIDRTKTTGAVIPFAQRDVADRYLYGADSRFERVVVDYFADTAKRIGEEVIDVLLKRSGKRKSLLKEAVAAAVAQAQLNYWQSASPKTRDDFFDDVNQMVRLMPKQELVSFAEALVNITSIKRKVSYEPETVGGPVDVAIISRHEGFIWVKRKHYFDAALNPRYFWRRFGGGREPSSGGV